ncbi:NXPE4 protein, partial [Polypterus senegalus]
MEGGGHFYPHPDVLQVPPDNLPLALPSVAEVPATDPEALRVSLVFFPQALLGVVEELRARAPQALGHLLAVTTDPYRVELLCSVPVVPKATRVEFTEIEKVFQALKNYLPTVDQREFSEVSNATNSRVTLLHPKEQYNVGDTMQVRVDMRDHKGNLKAHGGDFILSRIVSPTLKAAASGVVKDLKNGTYLVDFTLFWPGQVEVVLQLIHSREAVAVLWRVKQLHFDKCLFTGTFTNNSVTEKTKCFSYPNYSLPLCTYTDKRDNDTYFCLKPKTLPCETLTLFQSINNENPNMTNNETKLFDRHPERPPQATVNVEGVQVPLLVAGDPAYPLLHWLITRNNESHHQTMRTAPLFSF